VDFSKHCGVLRDLFLLNDRVDAGKHIYEDAVIRQLKLLPHFLA